MKRPVTEHEMDTQTEDYRDDRIINLFVVMHRSVLFRTIRLHGSHVVHAEFKRHLPMAPAVHIGYVQLRQLCCRIQVYRYGKTVFQYDHHGRIDDDDWYYFIRSGRLRIRSFSGQGEEHALYHPSIDDDDSLGRYAHSRFRSMGISRIDRYALAFDHTVDRWERF
jgi:hypothetical protein